MGKNKKESRTYLEELKVDSGIIDSIINKVTENNTECYKKAEWRNAWELFVTEVAEDCKAKYLMPYRWCVSSGEIKEEIARRCFLEGQKVIIEQYKQKIKEREEK